MENMYVLKTDLQIVLSILPSKATSFNSDQGNKQLRTVDVKNVCDGQNPCILVPKDPNPRSIIDFLSDALLVCHMTIT